MRQDMRKFPIRTRSLATAGALWALSGVEPQVVHPRPGTSEQTMFVFPPELEPALHNYLDKKMKLDEQSREGA
jgi:hypothetical protein